MSDKKRETVSDIVAQLRAAAHIQNADSPRDVLKFADRIEAAAKREREAGAEATQICGEIGEMIGMEAACKEKVADCNRLGNAAKIREAVENALDRLLLWNYTDQYTARMALGVVKKLHAAISAPPRNCDRHECATTKAAQDVWRKEDGGKTAYYEWLLATSTKGETK